MNGTGSERVGPMLNPPHLGELVGESMDEVGWNVTEAAARPSVRTRSPVATLQWQGGGCRRRWRTRWKHLAGVRPSIGCACRRATTSRRNEACRRGREQVSVGRMSLR